MGEGRRTLDEGCRAGQRGAPDRAGSGVSGSPAREPRSAQRGWRRERKGAWDPAPVQRALFQAVRSGPLDDMHGQMAHAGHMLAICTCWPYGHSVGRYNQWRRWPLATRPVYARTCGGRRCVAPPPPAPSSSAVRTCSGREPGAKVHAWLVLGTPQPHSPIHNTTHTHTHTQLHRPPQPWLDVLMLHSTKPEQKPCRAWPASARSAAECRAWQEGRPVLAGRKRATAPAGFRQRAGGSQHVVEVGGDVGDRERGVTGHNHLGSCAVVLHKGLQAQGGGGAQVRWPCRTSGTRPYCSKAAHCARMAQGRCFWFHTAAQHTRKHAPCGQSPTCLQREAAKSTASARFSCVHTMPAQPTEHSTGLALGVGASETRQRTGRWCRLHVRRKR